MFFLRILENTFYIVGMSNVNQYSIAFRPRQWDEVYGQDPVVKDLKKRIIENNIPKAILFQGPFGTGKTTLAHIFAAAVQKHDVEGNPDWSAASNKSILDETFNRDTIMFDGSSLRGVDDMEGLISQVKTRPMYDKKRIVIIEEADQISATAMKSLLKVLENPSPHTIFILLSMEDKKGIPASIQSRCQVYNIKPINTLGIMMACKNVMEKTGDWTSPDIPDTFKTEGLKAVATCAKGSLRSAMQFLERCISSEIWSADEIEDTFSVIDEEKTWKLLDGILAKTKDEKIWHSIIGLKNTSGDDGAQHFYRYAVMLLSEALICKQTGYAYDGDQAKQRLERMAANPDAERLFYCLTLNPQLSKPYMTTSDLLGALAAFYLGMDFRPGETMTPVSIPTVQEVCPSPAPRTVMTTATQKATEAIPTIPQRQVAARQPKVKIGTDTNPLPEIKKGVTLPEGLVF